MPKLPGIGQKDAVRLVKKPRLAPNGDQCCDRRMSHPVFHVVEESKGQWQVKRGPSGSRVAVSNTKATAVRKARKLSRDANGELIVHARTGAVVERHVARPATASQIRSALRKAYGGH